MSFRLDFDFSKSFPGIVGPRPTKRASKAPVEKVSGIPPEREAAAQTKLPGGAKFYTAAALEIRQRAMNELADYVTGPLRKVATDGQALVTSMANKQPALLADAQAYKKRGGGVLEKAGSHIGEIRRD
jgi:hypothetical protein